MATITFNGKTYNSIEEMPALERQAFEQLSSMFVDKNGNGIPDFLEGDLASNVITAFTSNVNINGKTYNNANELPDDMRQRVQGAFEKMAELGLVTKTSSPMMAQFSSVQAMPKPQAISQPITSQQYPSTTQEVNGPSILQWALAGIILFFCVVIAALGVLYFMR